MIPFLLWYATIIGSATGIVCTFPQARDLLRDRARRIIVRPGTRP